MLTFQVEFTLDPVTSYSTTQQPSAKRIKHLTPGTVQFENLVEKGVHGVVSKEAVPRISSPSKSSQVQRSPTIIRILVHALLDHYIFTPLDILNLNSTSKGILNLAFTLVNLNK